MSITKTKRAMMHRVVCNIYFSGRTNRENNVDKVQIFLLQYVILILIILCDLF